MRTVVLSDLHFGDPFGCDLLRYDWAREALWPLLDGADQLVLNGDTWEFAFQDMRLAIAASRPFFCELSQRCPGLTVVILPGNHDHHLVVQAADERREREALQLPDRDAFLVAPAERILKRLCPGVRVRSAYPMWVQDGVCYHHGHYLSSHLEGLGWSSFDRLQWMIWRQKRRHVGLTGADYEALMSPLHELCYQVAQLPDGVRAQKDIERFLGRLAAVAGVPGQLGHQVAGLVGHVRSVAGRGPVSTDPPQTDSEITTGHYLHAMAAVARNLRMSEHADQLIFGHTHTPMADAVLTSDPHWRFHNSGSFFYDFREATKPDYWTRCWPGSALEVINGSVSLHRLLSERDLRRFEPDTVLPQAQMAAHTTRRRRRRRSLTPKSAA